MLAASQQPLLPKESLSPLAAEALSRHWSGNGMWSIRLLAWAGMDMIKPCMCDASLIWHPSRDVSPHPKARSSMSCTIRPRRRSTRHTLSISPPRQTRADRAAVAGRWGYLLSLVRRAHHVEALRLHDNVARGAGHHAAACALDVLAERFSSDAFCMFRDVAQGHAFESFAFKLVPSMRHLHHPSNTSHVIRRRMIAPPKPGRIQRVLHLYLDEEPDRFCSSLRGEL